MASLRPSVLRFWETEFRQLKPKKSTSGQRLYSIKDLELVNTIKELLYTDKLTIEGARRKIVMGAGDQPLEPDLISADNEFKVSSLLQEIKNDLLICKQILEG